MKWSVQRLDESTYAKMMRTLTGMVPSIDSFAIITWENPRTTKATPQYNKEANEKLKQILKNGNYGYRQIKGKYDSVENPFMINNIDREYAKELGKQGNQSSIIYGERIEKDGRPVMKFEYLGLIPEESDQVRYVWRSAQNRDDIYSAYKGRKFIIPFFEDEFDENAKFVKTNRGMKIFKSKQSGGSSSEPLAASHNIFYRHEFDSHIITELEKRVGALNKIGRGVGMSAWGARGSIAEILNKYKKSSKSLVNEAVYDPSIFKAIFLAGGSGSGKSYVAKRTMKGHGLKVVNSDEAFEHMLIKAGLPLDLTSDFYKNNKDQYDSIRGRAKNLTKSRKGNYIDGRLGLVIDGTAKDYEKIRRQKQQLEELGYDTYMVFVNTSFEVAWQRNTGRPRTVQRWVAKQSWENVQKNKEKFRKLFGDTFTIVENDAAGQDVFQKVWKKIMKFIKRPIQNQKAKDWIDRELNKKNRK